ncbi:hypothetical protein D1872_261870 [compost metagenome]
MLLIDAVRLHEVRELLHDVRNLHRDLDVPFHPRPHHDKVPAFGQRRSQRFGRRNAVLLGLGAGRKDDTGTALRIPGDHQRAMLVLGMVRFFHARIKGLAVSQHHDSLIRLHDPIPFSAMSMPK